MLRIVDRMRLNVARYPVPESDAQPLMPWSFSGNHRSSDFAELAKCCQDRFHFSVLFERAERFDKAVSNLLRHMNSSWRNCNCSEPGQSLSYGMSTNAMRGV